MRIFNRNILTAAAIIILGIILYGGFYIVEIPDYAAYTKLMLHEVYTGENSDIVFLGSSKTYTSVCPEVVEDNLSMTAFDLTSSGQGLLGGYYLLKEYFNYHESKYVVLEMQENTLLGFERDVAGMAAGNCQISDALKKTGSTYWEYFKNAFSIDNYFRAFFSVSHYRSNFTFGFAKNRILSGDWINIIKNLPYGKYKGKGYINDDTCNGELIDKTIIKYDESVLTSETELCDKSLLYFEKIVDLCKKNNCQLILMTYPGIDNGLALNRVQECRDFYIEFAERYDLEYLNMMLCKEYSNVKDDAYDFMDAGHMNDSGARKFSYFVCKELKKVFDNEAYDADFYLSANEWASSRTTLIK